MRTSIIFSTFFIAMMTVLLPTWAANPAAVNNQFEPKTYVAPPLSSKRTKKTPAKAAPKVVPLAVKRMQKKLIVKHHPRHPALSRPHPHPRAHPRLNPHPPLHRKPHPLPTPQPSVFFTSLKRHHPLRHCVVHPGSLRANIERIAGQYGWHRVVWTLPQDYRWVGETRITAQGMSGLFTKLLGKYPLQAEFYQGNHVLVIIPRTIR